MTRKVRKSFFVAFLFLLASVYTTAAIAAPWSDVKARGVLRCGAAVAPAYVMKDMNTGKYSGFFVALCRQFAAKLGVKAKMVDTSWDNIVAGVQSGRWDLGLALNITPQRKRAVNFSVPVMKYRVTFLYRKGDHKIPGHITSLKQLNKPSITVAVMSGTVQQESAAKALPHAHLMPLPSDNEARLAVTSGRADLLADAHISNLVFKYAHPSWARIYDPKPPLAPQGVAFALAKSRPKSDVAMLNRFIESKKKSGEIHKLIVKGSKEAVKLAGK